MKYVILFCSIYILIISCGDKNSKKRKDIDVIAVQDELQDIQGYTKLYSCNINDEQYKLDHVWLYKKDSNNRGRLSVARLIQTKGALSHVGKYMIDDLVLEDSQDQESLYAKTTSDTYFGFYNNLSEGTILFSLNRASLGGHISLPQYAGRLELNCRKLYSQN